MLAVIWQDLRAEAENSVILFESTKQMARYVQCEHKLTQEEYERIAEQGYAIICPNEEGKGKLTGDDDEIHRMEYPRGSVSYGSVCCNDQREWEVC